MKTIHRDISSYRKCLIVNSLFKWSSWWLLSSSSSYRPILTDKILFSIIIFNCIFISFQVSFSIHMFWHQTLSILILFFIYYNLILTDQLVISSMEFFSLSINDDHEHHVILIVDVFSMYLIKMMCL